jgi:hypothetical protein
MMLIAAGYCPPLFVHINAAGLITPGSTIAVNGHRREKEQKLICFILCLF